MATHHLETKKDALVAFDAFVETWGVKYDKAVESLIKDREPLLAFYDFRPNIGNICARPTSSKARSPRSAIARYAQKAVSRTRLRSP
jgi:transposase-like protein